MMRVVNFMRVARQARMSDQQVPERKEREQGDQNDHAFPRSVFLRHIETVHDSLRVVIQFIHDVTVLATRRVQGSTRAR
jgi:hypothetical protein